MHIAYVLCMGLSVGWCGKDYSTEGNSGRVQGDGAEDVDLIDHSVVIVMSIFETYTESI